VQDWPERPYFCANAYWYGCDGFRAELGRLVGHGRRAVHPVTDRHEGGKGPTLMTASEVGVRSATYGSLLGAIREREQQQGLGVLWTSEAYDAAYEHLYSILPDCRHVGPC
jgi:hypothetical protein